MDNEKIQQYSTLIADFYGQRLYTDKDFQIGVQQWKFPFTDEHFYKISEMQFHTNWHWLMLAIAKLKKSLFFMEKNQFRDATIMKGHQYALPIMAAILKFDQLKAFEYCALTIKWFKESTPKLIFRLETVIQSHTRIGDFEGAYTVLYSFKGIFPNKEITRIERTLIDLEPEKNLHDTYHWKVWQKFNAEVPNWTDLPYVE